jgi:hypothetical protein
VIAEIIGPSGRVHYRRPIGHPLIAEALKTPGYSVRYVERETVEPVKARDWQRKGRVMELVVEDAERRIRFYGDRIEVHRLGAPEGEILIVDRPLFGFEGHLACEIVRLRNFIAQNQPPAPTPYEAT